MEWISVKDKMPSENNCGLWVTNERCGVYIYEAIYHSQNKTFTLYDPGARNHPPIEVTHWFEILRVPWFDYIKKK